MNSSQNNNRQLLKRVNSATNIISQINHNNDEVTDDDELVQKSSIISYQEEKPRENVAGKLRLQEEDIPHMDMGTLQQHLSTLREAIGQLYLGIKQKTKDENDIQSPEEEKEEREIIMSLDSYVIIEYIKSSVDIILNLKFEEIEKKLMDRNQPQENLNRVSLSQDIDNTYAKTRQSQHQKHSVSSSQQDSTNGNHLNDGPPQVYEEIIQKLEGEVRKHFRIEQQLKLHIDSLENRIEELENEYEKIDEENNQIKGLNKLKNDRRFKDMEELLKAKDDVIKMHEMQNKQVKEAEQKLKKDLEVTKGQLAEMIQKQKQSSIDCDNGQIILNKTQPMILKQAIKDGGRKMSLKQQNQDTMIQPQFGSYSSNNSFAMMVDGISPDKGRSTPDMTGHPYLHQTQIVQKRKSIGPGTGQKSKKFVPNSVVESLGLQQQFNAVNSTYTTASSGKVIGQRRLSSQHGRNNHTSKGATTSVYKATQNSWLGNPNSIQVPVASLFPQSQQSQQQIQGQPQFSNIINNNIQGLSINYQNQIIQPVDPIQQFANNFLGVQNRHMNDEDSESSTMNSHRRCKSQNHKRGSIERKRQTQHQMDQSGMLLINHIAETAIDSQKMKVNHNGPQNHLEETHSFEGLLSKQQQTQNQSFMMNESTNQLVNDFSNDNNNRKNFIMQGQSITSSKMRSGSNRGMLQQHNQAIDEFGRNRFNQSYGSNTVNVKQKKARNNLLSTSATNQSVEKTSNVGHSTGGPRTRNKKQNLTHNITMQNGNQYQVLTKQFDGNMIDLNTFKTTTSTSNNQIAQHNTTQVIGGGQANFSIPKQNNSATNTAAALLNQNNIHMLKQQILAHKKASNLLMKGGLSPHKKMN